MGMEKLFKSSLFLKVFSTTLGAVIALFFVMYLFSVPYIQSTAEGIEERTAHTVLNNIYDRVEYIHHSLENNRQAVLLARKAELRNIISTVEARAKWLAKEVQEGKFTHEQAKRRLLDGIRQTQYGNNDYVWASNYRSVLVSHPDPKLNNTDFSRQRDTRGNLIVPPMVAGALASGEGYYSYWWRRLGEERPIEKLTFYKHLPAFDLVIGTGVYLDDIDAALERQRATAIEDLRQQLHATRLARSGYVYIFDTQNNVIIHPNANIEGKNFAGMIDPATKQELPPMLKAAADKPDGVRYKWDSPATPGVYVYDKISWVRYFPGFDWYICSSVYVDELRESAQIIRNRMLVIFAITLLCSIALVYLSVKRLVDPLRQLSATAKSIEDGNLDARCPTRRDDEIGVVTAAFNGMVDRLQDNIQNLDAKVEERTAEREKAYAERKEAETNLCESEDYNKMLFQESLLPMVVMDPLSGFIDCNQAAIQIYGFASREDVLGKTLLDVSAPTQYDGADSGPIAQDHVLAALDHGMDIFEWRHRRPNGEIWDAVIHLMSFHYRGLPLLQFTLEDITEKRKAEEARRKLDQLKSDFLSSVSHELRTPMTSIVGFAKLIKKKLDDVILPATTTDQKTARAATQVRSNLDVIVSESERLTLLINDVLDSAKLEDGKMEWQPVSLMPAKLIERAVNVTATLAEQKGLKLSATCPTDIPAVTGDENRLLQVLINLISNAIKFTQDGYVNVYASSQEDQVVFSVEDSGIGIAGENQADVFDKFRQIGNTLTDKPQGTGLGLSICRQIVTHHGGKIWVDSEEGKGSTFHFSIPCDRACQS